MNLQPEQQIEAYLDRLDQQLTTLPHDKQEDIRRETRAHLEAMLAARNARDSAEEAAGVLQQFGDPAHIGRQIAIECHRKTRRERVMGSALLFCVLPIAFIAFMRTMDYAFRFNRELLISDDFGHKTISTFIYLGLCGALLLVLSRIYSQRRWACILLVATGWYHIYHQVDRFLWLMERHPQVAEHPFYYLISFNALLILASTTIISSILIVRWRRLIPGL